MAHYQLHTRNGHLFLKLEHQLWLLDTGMPISFGAQTTLCWEGQAFSLGWDFLGLNSKTLSDYVGVSCTGLLGADVLGRFDHLFDVPAGRLTVTDGELRLAGSSVPCDAFLDMPVVTANVGGTTCRMLFDTGAQLSYWRSPTLATQPPAGRVKAFYPGAGQFDTDTWQVPATLADVALTLQCGTLPDPLGAALARADADGIIGNAVMQHRQVGFFPRRRSLVLGADVPAARQSEGGYRS